ncbi:MAG: bifunctional transaldolase/phosoglucose isomerase [Nitrospirales bacterium]
MNPLLQLREVGQSPWYDYIRRGLMTSGQLKTLIDQDGLMGMTSNPAIFEKAIAGSADYDEDLAKLVKEGKGVQTIYETLAIQDIQDAADALAPVYQASDGRDGYVSLEVSPHLAFEIQTTIEEAVRLWKAVSRNNVMIKVPGTPQGLPAIEQLLSQGININITLLFSVEVYKQVAWAYIKGVTKYVAGGGNPNRIASVASFFVSRIDSLVDKKLEEQAKKEQDLGKRKQLEALRGQVAIANAKLAYQAYEEIFSSSDFRRLKEQGAHVQRLLWASTGTKNPKYPDTYYVDQLIGPDTVNTMPEATYLAFRDHGNVKNTIQQGLAEAQTTLQRLETAGISLENVAETLLQDGAKLFVDAFDQLMGVISQKRQTLLGSTLDRVDYAIGSIQAKVNQTLDEFRTQHVVQRLWAKDPTLWHQDPTHQSIIRNALGWLTVLDTQQAEIARLKSVADDVKKAGFQHILLLGMGGSSLCPEVSRMTFGVMPGYPELHVLDSTVPSQVRSFEQRVDLAKTICVVASKSGSTTEPLVFQKYFFERMRKTVGDKAGEHFIAITDPGSLLESLAKELKFRHILPGDPQIGGRYSALSNFGMVPAALMGVDVETFLKRAELMRQSCEASVPPKYNPGIILGTTLGLLAKAGKDKVTFVASPAFWDLGAWMEQLIAESTGKENKGIVPVDDEPLGDCNVYGTDRVFVYLRHESGVDSTQESKIAALEKAGHPVIRVHMADPINLGQQYFLWEIATAMAGSILGINAFDQPNVQESKDYTKKYLEAFTKTGMLPDSAPLLTDGDVKVYADEQNARAFKGLTSLEQVLTAHLDQVGQGDYVAINAYVERTDAVHASFQRIRAAIGHKKHVATTLGYGPRFLHSTGQLHKGGPNSGVFLQITCDDPTDLAIPGESYSFGVLKAAQALGDMQSLTSRNRRVIRVHLDGDVEKGLARLEKCL